MRLKTGLARSASDADFFTPSNWKTLDDEDADLGGTEALPFDIGPAKRVIAFGKDGNAYLVNRDRLGGMGGTAAVTKLSHSAIITAPAVLETPTAVMIAFANRGGCGANNVTMLKVTAGSAPISTTWCAAFRGRGAPIVTTTDGSANAIVWAVGAEGDNLLHGFNAANGQAVFAGRQRTDGRPASLPDIEVAAEGRLHSTSRPDEKVYAFRFARYASDRAKSTVIPTWTRQKEATHWRARRKKDGARCRK